MVDVELYGGKQGFLAHVRARALFALGAYRSLYEIDWASVRRLVFACKGNICRSPYASARARSLGVPAASFGLEAGDGAPADPQAAQNALLRGIDLSEHRAMKMQLSHIGRGDLIVAFEPRQLAEVCRRSAGQVPISLLGIWARPLRPHIQDPYGRSDRYFQHCLSMIDAHVAELARHMMSNVTLEGGHEAAKSGDGISVHKEFCDRTVP